MALATVNLAFQTDLLQQVDQFAKIEARTRTELVMEAIKLYIARRQNWERIFISGENTAAKYGLAEEEVAQEVKNYRREKRRI
jgi:metal-responsive CopG/Arc/MetJ family transcriptional regulator